MQRVNLYYTPGVVWHITHRCHKREFLLKFAGDRRRWLRWLFAAFGALAALAPVLPGISAVQNRVQLAPGWTVFHDKTGLVVPHPAGWQVRALGDGGFFAFRPEGGQGATAVVYVMPLASVQGTPNGVVQGLGQIAPQLFPGVRVFSVRTVSRSPAVALGNLKFSPHGSPFVGSVMCYVDGGRGVVYAIAAQQSSWARDQATLRRMLSDFFYSPPGGAPGPGGPPALPRMVTWQDPTERAFTVPVPAGWHVQGGVRRLGTVDVRIEVVATSPDRRMMVRIGDWGVPASFIPMNQFHAQAGLREGQIYYPSGPAAGQQMILRYLPGVQFLVHWYLPQRVGQFTVTAQRDDVQLSQQVTAFQMRMGLQTQSVFGEAAFDAQTNQGLRKGYAFVETRADQMLWFVGRLWGYLSAPQDEPVAAAVLNRMVEGFRTNPQWGMAQIHAAGQAAAAQHQANEEISNMINQGYKQRSLIQDRVHQRTIRAIRGETLLVDPTTGKQFEVPAGSNYYWRVQGGQQILGTPGPTRPNLPNHWVNQMEVLQ
jgi:hypothetical protein